MKKGASAATRINNIQLALSNKDQSHPLDAIIESTTKKKFSQFLPEKPDPPRLQWLKKHRHIRTFKIEKRNQ